MPGYLIRHADAGQRGMSSGHDLDRPLSDRGRDEAAAISERLHSLGIGRILSSRALRCTQTVGPLARRLDLPVEIDDILTEGARPSDVIDFLVEHRTEHIAMCSHGDIIPEVLRLLMLRGVELVPPSPISPKGSIWTIELTDEAAGMATYLTHP